MKHSIQYPPQRNEDGFTLPEMLIVVAIIAILVAIAIPVFSNVITQAKEATDAANCRNAKALASVECMTSHEGNFNAQSTAEWVSFVESKGIPDKGQVDSSSTLQCSIDGQSITFTYGKGSGGSGGSQPPADGSIIVKDSTGTSHTVKPTGNWATIRQSGRNGTSLSSGLVLSDDTGTYVVGWGGYANGDVRSETLAEVNSQHPGLIYRITSSTKIWTDADKVALTNNQGTVWSGTPSIGDMCYSNESYYLALSSIGSYTFPPNGWVAVAQ